MDNLTRERCQEIVKSTEAFFVAEREVNGYKVEMYNYRLASYTDFINHDAFELRGLTFIFDGENWIRHLAMDKFFNVNQTPGWMLEELEEKCIAAIEDKADGSMIQFIQFPDGKFYPKSKMSFESTQAKMASEIYQANTDLREMVENNPHLTFIFELVSPHNQIVLSYDNTDLILLKVREQTTGKYIPLDFVLDNFRNVSVVRYIDFTDHIYSVVQLMSHAKEATDIEGWVITFDDGHKAKLKTDWYLSLHGLIGDQTIRSNLLIETILDGNIDDVLSQLGAGEKRDFIVRAVELVNSYVNHAMEEARKLYDVFDFEYEFNKRNFAIDYNQHEYFHIIMQSLKFDKFESSEYDLLFKLLIESIKKRTNKLADAITFLEKLDEKQKSKIHTKGS